MIRCSRVRVAMLVVICWASRLAFGQFETRASFPVAAFPFSIAVGDFNGDARLDLAVFGGQLQVLLGNGDGTFQPPVSYAPGISGHSVATADFNHDGKLDLVVVSSQGVSVLLGNGDGTFQTTKTYTGFPQKPTFVGVGDFDGDHNLDLVTVDFPYISVLLGNGDGTFKPPINTLPPDESGPIGLGDFNADGKLDLAVGASLGGSGAITIMLGNGDGTFSSGASYTVGGRSDFGGGGGPERGQEAGSGGVQSD